MAKRIDAMSGVFNFMWNGIGDGSMTWATSSWDNGDVRVSLENFRNKFAYDRIYWRMELRRMASDGKSMQVIGSRTGYIGIRSPSHRTFTNVIPYMNRRLDVKVTFYANEVGTGAGIATLYTPLWTHYWR